VGFLTKPIFERITLRLDLLTLLLESPATASHMMAALYEKSKGGKQTETAESSTQKVDFKGII
jgi:hypothetical protein